MEARPSNVCRFEPTQRVLFILPSRLSRDVYLIRNHVTYECIRLRTSYFVLSVTKYLSGSRSVRKFPAGCWSIRFPALDEDKEWTRSIGRFSCSGHRKRTHGKNTVRRQLSRAPMIFSVVRLSFSADFSYFEHFPNDPRIRRVSTRNSSAIRTDVHTHAGLKKWKRLASLRVSTLSLNGTPFCRQQCVDSANSNRYLVLTACFSLSQLRKKHYPKFAGYVLPFFWLLHVYISSCITWSR